MALVSLGTSTVARNFNPNFLVTSQQSPTISQPFLVVKKPIRDFDIASASYSITKSLTLNDNTYIKRSFKTAPVFSDKDVFSPALGEVLFISTFTEYLVQSNLPFWS